MLLPAMTALLLPLLGTSLGSGCVFFLRRAPGPVLGRILSGFAAGIMTAASIWSLLLPAIEGSQGLGIPAWFPALAGIWAGFLFLNGLEWLTPRLLPEKSPSMTVLAVALHNLPEGMAVGAAMVGWLRGGSLSEAAVVALALGIAIQNLPEGAIISLPLGAQGTNRGRAFLWGVLSGVVEPVGAVLTIALAELALPALPYLLSFSAGAMLYVVVRELVPEAAESNSAGIYSFAGGFTLMMVLDVALG